MSLHEDRLKSIRMEGPLDIPIRLSVLPAAWMKHRDGLKAIADQYSDLFEYCAIPEGDWESSARGSYVAGEHVDAWGCVWSNIKHGQEAIVTGHPVPTREAVHALRVPVVDAGFPHGFMYLRLADLRGFEEIMVDFAEEPEELSMLIGKVLAYNVRQSELAVSNLGKGSPEVVFFGDDLGIQNSLPISPDKWRKYLKPCYAEIYKPVKAAGHYVYMHTDGHIHEIIPDLVDAGVDVINPQVRANGLDNLARVCRGRVCVDLDLDRQMFPFASPAQIDEHVHEVVEKLGAPEGGLWLTAEIDDGVPLANVTAILGALRKYRRWFAVRPTVSG